MMFQCYNVILSEFRINPHAEHLVLRINIFLNRKECFIATSSVTNLKLSHTSKQTGIKNSNVIPHSAYRTMALNINENVRNALLSEAGLILFR